MGWIRRALPQVALVVTTAVVTALLMGGDVAGAFNVPNNSVTSAKIVNGAVRTPDLQDGAVTAAKLGPALRPMWAKVGVGLASDEFEVIRGRGVTGASIETPGLFSNFIVTFARPVNGCGWTATMNDNGAQAADPKTVTVQEWGFTAARNDLKVEFWEGPVRVGIPPGDGVTLVVHC